jgi:hypothetical protein
LIELDSEAYTHKLSGDVQMVCDADDVAALDRLAEPRVWGGQTKA